jgi:hypothetical protein
MNREQLKEARRIAQERAQGYWDRTSDISPEIRPFVALERAIRVYGRVVAHIYKHCDTYDAQEVINVASSFYPHTLERLQFAQTTELPLRIWLCQSRFPDLISYGFDHAHGVYIARVNPRMHNLSSADLDMLRHAREETRVLMVLNGTFNKSLKDLVTTYEQRFVTCHPHALMSFLIGYRRRLGLEVLVGQDLSDVSLPLIPYHAKYTLDLLEDLIHFFTGQEGEVWPPGALIAYISFVPEVDFARIDITSAGMMTPPLWELLLDSLETGSEAFQYLPEWGAYIEPLAWDQGYGQGVSLRLPWVKP